MGCNCSSDYSDNDWIENLDEICEHCNCPISPQSCNPVSEEHIHVILIELVCVTALYTVVYEGVSVHSLA